MSLFVPVLRLSMLFFNVYNTFKTLKPPRPSARSRAGLPSQASLTQRKRDMKGCLAVWIVWCCIAIYERHFERIVSLFVPFYSEFKALVLLFVILTKAKGAEPIFLHIIRPFLRPYTSTIDMILEVSRMIGDIVFSLLGFITRSTLDISRSAHEQLPSSLQMFSPFTYFSASLPVPVESYTAPASAPTQNEATAGFYEVTSTATLRETYRQPSAGPSNMNGNGNANGHAKYPYPVTEQLRFPTQGDQDNLAVPAPSQHHPLRSVNSSPQPTPRSKEDAWEWDWDARQYPSFPSAYPPTPYTNAARLPTTSLSSTSSQGKGRANAMRIRNDPWRAGDGAILEDVAEERQGFQPSLLPPRRPLNPNYGIRGLSDDSRGADQIHEEEEEDEEDSDAPVGDERIMELMDVDLGADAGAGAGEEESLSEDNDVDSDGSFNVTLQTPGPRAPLPPSGSNTSMTLRSTIRARASARSLFVSPSIVYPSLADSERNRSRAGEKTPASSRSRSSSRHTGLTTTDNGSLFRTDSSGSVSVESLSGSVSVSGSMIQSSDSDPERPRVGQKRSRSHGRTISPEPSLNQTLRVTQGKKLELEVLSTSEDEDVDEVQTRARVPTRTRKGLPAKKIATTRSQSQGQDATKPASSLPPLRKRRRLGDAASDAPIVQKLRATTTKDPVTSEGSSSNAETQAGENKRAAPVHKPSRPVPSKPSSNATITKAASSTITKVATRSSSRLRGTG
ncbi:hva22 tb2 dp1 family protein [Moniliophthora roreri]|uniref:Protein YOP1 n=1 Tax=Moniliophthora roreri TaxID=221103 RepID=A0A0W0FP31_MONRR|nr:hva22 tb2 dp1 family protein [Moniliophthora roreri]